MDLDILEYNDSRTLRKKRKEILEAARTLFIDQGIDRVSMQMIAEASSITRRSLYNYYDSKEKIAVDIQILNLVEVNFFDTWNIIGKTGEEVRDLIRHILENQIRQYMFISCFDLLFSKGYPDRKYIDFLHGEISKRAIDAAGDLDNGTFSASEYGEVEWIIAYTQRLVMRLVRESLSYSDVEEEVALVCSLLV